MLGFISASYAEITAMGIDLSGSLRPTPWSPFDSGLHPEPGSSMTLAPRRDACVYLMPNPSMNFATFRSDVDLVPEPGAYALMSVGLGLVALTTRRRAANAAR